MQRIRENVLNKNRCIAENKKSIPQLLIFNGSPTASTDTLKQSVGRPNSSSLASGGHAASLIASVLVLASTRYIKLLQPKNRLKYIDDNWSSKYNN